MNTDELRERLNALFPQLVDELSQLVAIPSVSSDPSHAADVDRSAEHIRSRFEALGLDAQIHSVTTPEGVQGKPAILARSPHIEGAPTVLLYAHHDVQPTGDLARWHSAPWTTVVKGDRIYGRGTSDDGAGVIVHLGSLSLLGKDLGANVVVYIEGEEEIGSPSFTHFLETYRDQLEADVIIVTDSDNWKPGEPAVTTSLRGNCAFTVDLTVADHAVHSGMFGGPMIDAPTCAALLIASLYDQDGNIVVEGLGGDDHAEVDWPEDEFRAASGMLDQVRLAGSGDLAARTWTKPSVSLIGFDTTSVANSSNTIIPHVRFRLSMRTVRQWMRLRGTFVNTHPSVHVSKFLIEILAPDTLPMSIPQFRIWSSRPSLMLGAFKRSISVLAVLFPSFPSSKRPSLTLRSSSPALKIR